MEYGNVNWYFILCVNEQTDFPFFKFYSVQAVLLFWVSYSLCSSFNKYFIAYNSLMKHSIANQSFQIDHKKDILRNSVFLTINSNLELNT
jgi:hypothetical protein